MPQYVFSHAHNKKTALARSQPHVHCNHQVRLCRAAIPAADSQSVLVHGYTDFGWDSY